MFGFGGVIYIIWVSFSSRTRKLTLENFLKGPNRINFKNREYTEIAGNSVKNGSFRLSKHQNSVIFKISTRNFVQIYTWYVFPHIFRFLKNRKFSSFFENIFDYFLNFFKTFTTFKIWDSSSIETFTLNFLLKTNLFYHLNCLRDSVSRKHLFLTKIGKTWRHSDVIYMAHASKLVSFPFVRMCKIDGLDGTENLAMIRT